MQDFRKLRVWHLARRLATEVIQALPPRVARSVPGLRAQAVRAATSVGFNIVEGCGQATRPEFLSRLETALASLNEVEGQMSLARDAGVLTSDRYADFQDRIALVRRMLLSLADTLRRRIAEDESARRRTPLRLPVSDAPDPVTPLTP